MLIPKDVRSMRRFLLLLTAVLISTYAAFIAISLIQDYRGTMTAAETASRRLAAALSEHANRAIGEADGLLLSAIEDVESSSTSGNNPDASAVSSVLQPYSNVLPQLIEMIALDGEGRVLASGLSGPFPALAYAGATDVIRHHTGAGPGLYLSRPFKNPGGRWVLTISRAIAKQDGTLHMVLAAVLAVDYFEEFYSNVMIGEHGHLLLIRHDGWILVESPLAEKAVDINISGAPLFSRWRESRSGTYQTDPELVPEGIVGDSHGVVGYVDSHSYPFIAVAYLSRADILQTWRVRATNALATGLVSTLLTLFLLTLLHRYFNELLRTQRNLQQNNENLARSERRYLELVNGIDGIVWECHFPSMEFSYVSSNATRISGRPPAQWLKSAAFWEEHLGTPRGEIIDAVVAAEKRGSLALPPMEHHTITPEGREIWLLNNVGIGTGADGAPALRGVMVDNSDRKRAYQDRELAAKVFDTTLHAVMILARDGTILRANKAMSDMIGYPAEEIVGLHTSAVESDFHDPAFARSVRAALRSTGKWKGEVNVHAKNGDALVLMQSMSLIRDADGQPQTVIVICNDITSQRKSEGQLYDMTHFDRLTHLPNRQTFAERAAHAIRIAARTKSNVAVLSLDIDHFKTVNDSLGHAAGDTVLREVAERIRSCLRPIDTVARTSGDEFLVLMEEVQFGTEEIEQLAEKLCEAVSMPIPVKDTELYLGLSIGISVFPQDGDESETLMRNADTAMYRAKSSGRSCSRFFDESMARHAARRVELQAALRRAISRGELVLYYQPQYSLKERRIVGVEALTRWDRPGVGVIGPQEFIPDTEDSALIVSLGNWVMKEACRQAAAWLRDRNVRLRVGVNISARQIYQDDFVEQIRANLAETGMPPELLELEITESSILENVEESAAKLEQLKALGISVAIDDFGTGYSSLSYLKMLPIDRLKIDKSFVKDTPGDADDSAIVRTIIAMSSTLGLPVIAEGVETQAQADFLTAEGCDEIQGYLIARPLPATAVESFLQRRQDWAPPGDPAGS